MSDSKPNTARSSTQILSQSTTSACLLSTCRDGDFITSLGTLFQCLTGFLMENFFLISNLNGPWYNLRPFSLSYHSLLGKKHTLDTQMHSATATCEVVVESDKFYPEPPDFITPVASVVPGWTWALDPLP